ncbi:MULTISPECIES: cupin domain-containing protein [unclassified Streptomyces]|uniref:cupin domain-containing protein n=1 Tax=unclassified Streptomyces TaxID=2593676 RepID=UPI0022553F48|nr:MULTISPECIES: cupin domain-containing protein [unclassified Streptomyces]MCX4527693.1 cupin domain-containing protein [Streptomyces sp. NBC_01551]MCX4541709.1 cupin domain-containing protein [Streptomyces sp. NBC_01565]
MGALVSRNFDAADETRPFEAGTGRLDLLNTDGGQVGRAVFEPGWRWTLHIKPLAGTDTCQAAHTGYVVSGRMEIVMDEGGERAQVGPGDFIQIAPGHDAWVVGNEPCVVLDWTGYGDYAKPGSG